MVGRRKPGFGYKNDGDEGTLVVKRDREHYNAYMRDWRARDKARRAAEAALRERSEGEDE